MTQPIAVPVEPLTWRSKGLLPGPAQTELDVADVIGTSIFDGPFTWPLLTLSQSAVRHNVAQLAAFCAERGVRLAPHAKTTMSPALVRMQLDAGAWAVTVATAHQVLAARSWGTSRVLLANELIDPRALRRIAAELDADDNFEFYCYVDSVAGVGAIAAATSGRAFTVLVEVGRPGGRTGCRDAAAAVEVAVAAGEAGLQVAGIAGYEGGLSAPSDVHDYVLLLRDTAMRVRDAGALRDDGPCIVTAGGSSWFDVVADALTEPRPDGVETLAVLRSGADVGHDHGFYQEATPYAVRLAGRGELRPAMRLWAQVLSTPEPGLAVAGFGKRDASFDLGLPTPLFVRAGDGATRPAQGMTVTKLDDQHAYISTTSGSLAVGDLVAFGLSHPCTAFDKWSTICVVDDDDRVTDVLHTYF
ncbi:MAG: alanine racemase [Mycobacteriales bacterium]